MSCARWASPFRNSRSRCSSASRDKLGQGRGCADYLTALEPLDLGRGGRQDARGRQIGPAGAGYFDNDSTRHLKGMVFGAGSSIAEHTSGTPTPLPLFLKAHAIPAFGLASITSFT